MSQYLTPKEIWDQLGITPTKLKSYRRAGYLQDVQWTPGRGKPFYNVEEVKRVFPNFKEKSVKKDATVC